MKKWTALLLSLVLVLSLAGCDQEMTMEKLEYYVDEFVVTNHFSSNGIVALELPKNLPMDCFQFSVTGVQKTGETVDLLENLELKPGKSLVFQDLESLASMEIVIEDVLDGTVYPSFQWNLDLETGQEKSQRSVN